MRCDCDTLGLWGPQFSTKSKWKLNSIASLTYPARNHCKGTPCVAWELLHFWESSRVKCFGMLFILNKLSSVVKHGFILRSSPVTTPGWCSKSHNNWTSNNPWKLYIIWTKSTSYCCHLRSSDFHKFRRNYVQVRKIIFQTPMFSCLSMCVCASKFKTWANSGCSRLHLEPPGPLTRQPPWQEVWRGRRQASPSWPAQICAWHASARAEQHSLPGIQRIGWNLPRVWQVILVHVDCEHLSTIFNYINYNNPTWKSSKD